MIRVRWIAISFLMRQRCFPHIGMLSFLHRMHKRTGRPLMQQNSFTAHFERVLFVLKDFDKSWKQKPRNVYNFICSPHTISVVFKLRPDFVIWKMGLLLNELELSDLVKKHAWITICISMRHRLSERRIHMLPGGAVASWSVCSTPDRVVRVRVLTGDIVLCSWTRQFTLTVPLFIQVYNWVPAKCWG